MGCSAHMLGLSEEGIDIVYRTKSKYWLYRKGTPFQPQGYDLPRNLEDMWLQ